VLRKIYGSKTKEVAQGWRRQRNEELYNLYASSNIIRVNKSRLRWEVHVARMRKMKRAYSILVTKPEGKRPLGKHMRRWGDNITMDVKEIVWKIVG
jgi:hypothetical protein